MIMIAFQVNDIVLDNSSAGQRFPAPFAGLFLPFSYIIQENRSQSNMASANASGSRG